MLHCIVIIIHQKLAYNFFKVIINTNLNKEITVKILYNISNYCSNKVRRLVIT